MFCCSPLEWRRKWRKFPPFHRLWWCQPAGTGCDACSPWSGCRSSSPAGKQQFTFITNNPSNWKYVCLTFPSITSSLEKTEKVSSFYLNKLTLIILIHTLSLFYFYLFLPQWWKHDYNEVPENLWATFPLKVNGTAVSETRCLDLSSSVILNARTFIQWLNDSLQAELYLTCLSFWSL